MRGPVVRILGVSAVFLALSLHGGMAPAADPTDGATPGAFRASARPVDPASVGIGALVPDFAYTDIQGRRGRLSSASGKKGLAIVMRDVGCPVGKRYGPKLARLEKELSGRRIGVLYLNISPQDDEERIRDEIETFGFKAPYISQEDVDALPRHLQPRSTTEVWLLDASRTLIYRGAIDDQYGIGFSRPEATRAWFMDAVDDLLSGTPVRVEATTAPGCAMSVEPPVEQALADVTYHNRISRILQRNCASCHRDGGVAPFSLQDYKSAKGYSAMIDLMVENGAMPPWFADEGSGPWVNSRALDAKDRDALLHWVNNGTPKGDRADVVRPLSWPEGWLMGEPDAVVQINEPIQIPAEGVVDYLYTYVKTDFPEDRWVSRMQILPTAPQVTHHVLVFLEEPGREPDPEKYKKGEPRFQRGGAGYFVSTVPGQQPADYGDGLGKLLPKGAWLKFQLHYTPNGKAATDQTRIGFVFADKPPRHRVRTSAAFNTELRIPPGDPNYAAQGALTFPVDAMVLSFFPHMHLRGKSFKYELLFPDGTIQDVLPIARYDFNWQVIYELREPIQVPAGTRMLATGWFDNSANNPANPDPEREVRWGDQTFDEMMIGYVDWIAVETVGVAEGRGVRSK